MPNPLIYASTTPNHSLHKGDVAVGVNSVEYNPSNGWINGAIPTDWDYVIYKTTSGANPNIFAPANEQEFYNFVLMQGGSSSDVTSVGAALAWIATQSDLLALHSSLPNIVTDGLVLNVDANAVGSYPTTGTTWYDLSGEGNNLTIYGTSPYNGYSFGVGLNSDIGSYVQVNPFPFPTGDYTIILTEKVNFNQANAIFSYEVAGIANTSLMYAPGGGMNFYGPSGAIGMGYTLPSNEWYQIARVRTKSTGNEKMYVNGVLVSTKTLAINTSTATNGSLNIGQEQDSQGGGFSSSQTMNGYIAGCKIYNRTLSNSEILQNYYQSPIVTDGLVFAVDAGNLVSYENGDTTTNSLVGSSTGTLVNGVGFDSANGGTWDFDGVDDKITLPNDLGYSATSVSVFAWYKINGSPARGYHIICGDSQLEMSIHNSYTFLRNGLVTTNGRFVSNNGNLTLNDGNYHYYGFTFDGSTKTAYVDGVVVGTQSVTGTLTTSFSGRKLGSYGNYYYANGNMASYLVWNKVLTPSEVTQNYNAQSSRFQ